MRPTPEQRAKQLLDSYLNAEQQRTLNEYGFFITRAKNGEVYAITRTPRAIALKLGWPRTIHHAYPPNVPVYDAMLAMMLTLKTSPMHFHRTACEVRWTGYIYISRAQGAQKVGASLLRASFKAFLKHERELPRPPRRRWWQPKCKSKATDIFGDLKRQVSRT